jgi:hypothetical protein
MWQKASTRVASGVVDDEQITQTPCEISVPEQRNEQPMKYWLLLAHSADSVLSCSCGREKVAECITSSYAAVMRDAAAVVLTL